MIRKKSRVFYSLVASLLLLSITYSRTSFAQGQRTVTGKVLSLDNTPLAGASVQVKGGSTSTTTDNNGAFSIAIQGPVTLTISYVGFNSQELYVDTQTNIEVTLLQTDNELIDVVVVGYGTQNRRNVAAAISKVSAGEFKNTVVNSVDQVLNGRVTGVQMQETSGEPGADVVLRIRGNNSLSGNNEPLYVIDGLPIPPYIEAAAPMYGTFRQNGLYGINPNDIASIEILKDAAATSIYGSRGANGVVLITTKSGRRGDGKIELVSKTSVGNLSKPPAMMDARQYAGLRNELAALMQNPPDFNPDTIASSTDWFDEISRNSFRQEASVNFSGGGPKSSYYLSAGFLKDDGPLLNSDLNRGNIRVNMNSDITKWYTVKFQATVTRQIGNRALTTSKGFPQVAGAVLDALRANPILTTDFVGREKGPGGSTPVFSNPYIDLTQKVDKQKNDNILFNIENVFTITDYLRLVASIGGSQDLTRRQIFFNSKLNDGFYTNGQASNAMTNTYSYNATGYLSFDKSVKDIHRISAVAGAEYNQSQLERLETRGNNYGIQILTVNSMGIAQNQNIGSYREDRTIQSGFARVTYSFMEKYILNLSGRVDGASPFAENKKTAFFPAAGIAWNVREEKFLSQVDFIEDLKIRASYGKTGSQSISPYSSLSSYNSSTYQYGVPPQISVITLPVRLGNPNLTWEETEQYNIGVDLGALNNRVQLSFDYYRKLTKGLLQQRSIPSQSGFNSIIDNDGTMRNQGIELSLRGDVIQQKDFRLSSTIIFNRNVNTLISLGGNSAARYYNLSGNLQGGVSHVLKPGERVGNFYGYVVEGLVQPSDLDGSGNPTYPYPGGIANQIPGAWKYKNLNKDQAINADDREVLGNGAPDFTYGWNTDITFKRLSLNLFFNGAVGNEVLNMTSFYLRSGFTDFVGVMFNQSVDWYDNRWTTTNQHNDPRYPSLQKSGAPSVGDITSAMIEKGDFFRLRSLTLSYSFRDGKALKSPGIYITGTNLFTLTKYSGFDPEVSSFGQSVVQPGVDFGAYPRIKTITLGLTCSF